MVSVILACVCLAREKPEFYALFWSNQRAGFHFSSDMMMIIMEAEF
jgi:hypothetical protein